MMKINRNENIYLIVTTDAFNEPYEPHKAFEIDFDDYRIDLIEKQLDKSFLLKIEKRDRFVLKPNDCDRFIINNVYPYLHETFRVVSRLCQQQNDGKHNFRDGNWYVIDGVMYFDGVGYYEMYFLNIIKDVVILPDTVTSLATSLFAPRSSANGGV